MVNRKPVAGDLYAAFFDPDASFEGNMLENTPSTDVDGDRVVLNFINGHRIAQPSSADAEPMKTVIQGQYGTLTVFSDGSYSYALDHSNPVVADVQPGDKLVEKFSFKISDGKGATDTGHFSIALDLPERGDVFASFEDVGNHDFPTGYKGFDWGAWRDGDDAFLNGSSSNHYMQGGSFWTPINHADGHEFSIKQFRVANGTADYDNILTITGERDGNVVFSQTVVVTADKLDHAQIIDLSAYGPIDYLILDTEPVDPENAGPFVYGAQYDDFHFLV